MTGSAPTRWKLYLEAGGYLLNRREVQEGGGPRLDREGGGGIYVEGFSKDLGKNLVEILGQKNQKVFWTFDGRFSNRFR